MLFEFKIIVIIRYKFFLCFFVWFDDVFKLIKICREIIGLGYYVWCLVGIYCVSGKC